VALTAAHDHAAAVAVLLGLGAMIPVLKAVEESAIAMATLIGCVRPRAGSARG
jgi:hypothetical protein